MKSDDPVPVMGDVIGNTAYSQRFVLKILLNLANGTLNDKNKDEESEDNLCTLWDMTAEKDVALFLHEHDALNLIYYVLPTSSLRIKEILIGIMGNMCCQKQVAATLLKMDALLMDLFEYLKSDNTSLLVQLLRLMTTCLYMADADDLNIWMDIFIVTEHSSVLYYILEYSADKELLYGSLEHFNTICEYFNTEMHRTHFLSHFIKVKALNSLAAAVKEITENQLDDYERHDLELVFVRCLHIAINLVGFDNSLEMYRDHKEDIITIITPIISYYADKLVDEKEIDTDLIDIIDTINTIIKILKINEISEPEMYFKATLKMWEIIYLYTKTGNNFRYLEEENRGELQDVTLKFKVPLSTLLGSYIAECSEENLLNVLDDIGKLYEEIVISLKDTELAAEVYNRLHKYLRHEETTLT